MRFLALLTLLASPAVGDTLAANGHITQVTVYDEGAQVTRDVVFTAAPGRHRVVIADLPAQIDARPIRLSASHGVSIGAWSLHTDRLSLPADIMTPAQTVAAAFWPLNRPHWPPAPRLRRPPLRPSTQSFAACSTPKKARKSVWPQVRLTKPPRCLNP
ncbi:DUF4140 domain-containing protein [Fuscibacter oryzae]|uniref:DUF4140 domain-containing protein n=1 Tax=Fuscibacter oryzae TaxID=2803939 RepID=A0A8J7MU08_9RHOB|nr:DUF4140 domain-containing protein [Fuscibacter oryzae]MBL4929602.1 DUF4140 domain-containing protein [Fuscibacter oryzae]